MRSHAARARARPSDYGAVSPSLFGDFHYLKLRVQKKVQSIHSPSLTLSLCVGHNRYITENMITNLQG